MEDTDELDNLHLQHITTHPNYLHSNSTSHKWVFGAIAELIGTEMNLHSFLQNQHLYFALS